MLLGLAWNRRFLCNYQRLHLEHKFSFYGHMEASSLPLLPSFFFFMLLRKKLELHHSSMLQGHHQEGHTQKVPLIWKWWLNIQALACWYQLSNIFLSLIWVQFHMPNWIFGATLILNLKQLPRNCPQSQHDKSPPRLLISKASGANFKIRHGCWWSSQERSFEQIRVVRRWSLKLWGSKNRKRTWNRHTRMKETDIEGEQEKKNFKWPAVCNRTENVWKTGCKYSKFVIKEKQIPEKKKKKKNAFFLFKVADLIVNLHIVKLWALQHLQA